MSFPVEITQGEDQTLVIRWDDDLKHSYPVRKLRQECRCAICVDEISGQRRLDPESIPQDIKPIKIRGVGRYAIHISWTDGHDSGIYSFKMLRQLGESQNSESCH